jgi:hypothetical protein
LGIGTENILGVPVFFLLGGQWRTCQQPQTNALD